MKVHGRARNVDVDAAGVPLRNEHQDGDDAACEMLDGARMSAVAWLPAYIGIGSNLGDSVAEVRLGFGRLAELPKTRLIARSSLYRTKPLGPQDQPHYINAAAGLLTELSPLELLQTLKQLEREMGRAEPIVRWGPRVIDFDVLMMGRLRHQDEHLTLPHPGIAERAFVLVPLAEIAADVDVPGLGRVALLRNRVDATGVEKI